MKKIAYVITQSEMGGAQKNILLLCHNFKNEYDITVYSGGEGNMIDKLHALGVKHVKVKDMVREINPLKDYKAYRFLTKEFKKNKYDIVHCHSSKAGVLGREAAKKTGINNIVFTAHGFVFNEPMNFIKKGIYKFIEKHEAKNTHTIICVDPEDVVLSKKYNMKPKKNIVYIPNGIDFKEHSIEYEKTSTMDRITFGLVANFYATKGHKYLIQAFNELIEEGYKAQLILIGDGELKDSMGKLAENNKNIKFLGYRQDAEKILKTLDCFVLSSVKEGFPYVILEAIKNKIPIIATKVGAVPEMLGNGEFGLLVDKEDSTKLKESMIYIINNRKEAKYKAELAYENCIKKYSIESCIDNTRKVYR